MRYYNEPIYSLKDMNIVAVGFIIGFFISIVIMSFNKSSAYKEGYIRGQEDYSKGWINIKKDTKSILKSTR